MTSVDYFGTFLRELRRLEARGWPRPPGLPGRLVVGTRVYIPGRGPGAVAVINPAGFAKYTGEGEVPILVALDDGSRALRRYDELERDVECSCGEPNPNDCCRT